jgi:hypothetical protein
MSLAAFEIPKDRLQLFLREDRDAESEEAIAGTGSDRTRVR